MNHRSRTYIFVAIILTLVVSMPVVAEAKSLHGYERGKGKDLSVSQPLGWPIHLESTVHLKSSIESLPGFAVIRLKAYNPWWRFFKKTPETTLLMLAGFPADTPLHVYTKGYREHEVKTTDASGALSFTVASKEGGQFIIKVTPSTKHISIDPLLDGPGDDCDQIGLWNAATKTCTLNRDVAETIAIEDSGITLDGAGHAVSNATGDGVYTDESNVVVKNITVRNSLRGVVYSDSVLTFASGGTIANAIVDNNGTNILDEGVSGFALSNSTIVRGAIGVSLRDQTDGHATDGIFIIRNNFKENDVDIANYDTGFALSNSTDRGNFWDGDTNCTQDSANHNHCTNGYNAGPGTDARPWACENGWRVGVTCPYTPPTTTTPTTTPPVASGDWAEINSTSGTAKLYMDASPNESRIHKILPNSWALKVLERSGNFWKVEDVTDGVVGWMEGSLLRIENSRQDEWANQALVIQDTATKRKAILFEAVNHYYDNTDASDSLFSSNDQGKLNRNNISSLKANGFIKALILATSAWEADAQFNNEFVSYDYGHGLKQITFMGWYTEPGGFSRNNWDNRGVASRVEIPPCKNRSSNEYYKCYHGAGTHSGTAKPYKPYDGVTTNPTYKQYTNSKQSIYSNVKDGMRLLSNAMISAKATIGFPGRNWAEGFSSTLVISDLEFQQMAALRQYNAGPSDRCFPVRSNNNPEYLKNVGTELRNSNSTFSGLGFVDSGNLSDKLALASAKHDRITTCSPVYLEILNASGRKVGFTNNAYVHQLPNVVYDRSENRTAFIFFPRESYSYRVVGFENGTYSLAADSYTNTSTFIAVDIPITVGAVHEYTPDWSRGSVRVRVDADGNGTFEPTFNADLELIAEEFAAQVNTEKKVVVCHIPPGNAAARHTLSIGHSALKAHIGHGDHEGSCEIEIGNPASSPAPAKSKDKDKKNKK